MAVYEVQGPDGTIYEIEGPPNAKDEQIIGALRSHLQDQRIQGLRAETERLRGLESQVPEAVPERGLFGYAKEIPKGIISGGLGLLETAAVGASALAPDEMEPGIRKSISSVADTLKSPFAASPGYEDTVVRKLSEAGGSTVPLYVMGALGGPAGIAGAVALTAGAGAGEARLRAEGAEATPEQIQTATQLGVGVGLSEMLPVARFTRALGRAGTGSIIDQGKRVLAQAGVEGLQEWAAGVSQNLIAKGVYDPEQGVFTDTGEDLGYGAGVGGIIQGITEMVVGRKVRRAGAQPSQVEDDKQTPDSLILGATQDLSEPADAEPMIRESAPGIEIAYPAEGQNVGALQEGLGALEGEPAPVTGERRILAPEVESQILQAVPPGLSPEQAAEAIQSIVEDALEGVPQSVKERAVSELLGAYQELSAPSVPAAPAAEAILPAPGAVPVTPAPEAAPVAPELTQPVAPEVELGEVSPPPIAPVGEGTPAASVPPRRAPSEGFKRPPVKQFGFNPQAFEETGVLSPVPIEEGGAVFPTKTQAQQAKSMGSGLKIRPVDGGYILVEQTAKEIAANKKKSQRLISDLGITNRPLTAEEFLAAQGGINPSMKPELRVDGNLRLGNRYLFAGKGKTGLDESRAAELLTEAGYMSPDEDLFDVLNESIASKSRYSMNDWNWITGNIGEADYQDYLASAKESPNIDNDLEDVFGPRALEEAGFNAISPELKAEVAAITAQANALGVDVYGIEERAAIQGLRGAEFERIVADRLKNAIEEAERSRLQDDGEAAAEGQVAPPKIQDIEAGAQGIPQPSTAYQETRIISTSEDVAALNQDIRDEKIKQYQSLKQRLSAIQRRFIEGRSAQFDAAMYRFMYKEAEDLKAEIDASREIKDSPEDFMARAAKALADGDIERDVYDVINTMFQQNPDFLDGLRLSIKSPGEAGVAGQFNPLARIIRLFKGTEGVMSPSVVRHELTHSMEQMMPPDVRKKLVDKWRAELEKARNTDQSTQAQKYFDAVVEFIKNPTNESQNNAIKQLPDYRYYQYLNPSEYWAVNAEPLMKSYLGGSWQRFKTSMRGMLEAIKKVLGLSNNSEIYQAFRQAINGERKGTNMLIEYIRSNAPIYQIEHRNYQGNPAPLPTWEMPADTVINTPFGPISKTSGKQMFVDKMVDIVDAQKAIEKKSKQIEDFMDVAGKETLFHGKVARAEEKFMNTDVQPILQEMKDNQITSQEFGAYALALHAKERNERIARINPKFADGGSGIETARAEAYLARLSPEKRKALESINKKVRKIIEGTQDLEVKYGLTDKATVESGRQIYPNYVPLFRDEVDYTSGGSGLGQGLDVRGATSKRAVGSERAVKDILNSVIEQRQRAIIRGEKGEVGKALYALSIANPNSDFWLPINPEAIKDVNALADEMLSMGLDPKDAENIMQAPKVPQVVRLKDPNTGEYYEQVKYVVSPSANFSENVLSTRVNGQNRYVIFNPNNERARRLVRTLKNLDTEQLDYLTQKMGNVTRWMASMSTQYNPIFGLWNFTRDLQGAALNLSTTPLKGQQTRVLSEAFKMLPQMYKEYRAARRGEEAPGQFAELLRRFRAAGAQTGYRDQFARAEKNGTVLQQQLLKLNAGNVRKTVNAVAGWLSDYNDTLENAVRLSAFKRATEMGISDQKAAVIAKNLTVNFNRKGSKTPGISALYAFFNAAVQGIDRMTQTLKGPAGKSIIAGGLALGSIQALILQAFDFGEDEPNEFIKQKNLIIPTGNGGYLMWPMPLGFNFLPNTGRILTEMTFDGRTKGRDRVVNLMEVMADAFNPLGGAGFLQTISPSAIDPFVAVFENRDAFGRPVSREDQATNPTPGYMRSRENATEFSKYFAEALNAMTGGTQFTKGIVSPTADDIDYVVGQYLGGVGRELQRIYGLGKSQLTGEEIEQYRVPILGKLYGETTSPAAISSNFYRTVTRMAEHESEIKGRMKEGRDSSAYIQANPEARMYVAANSVENQVSNLNRSIREIRKENPKDPRIKLLEDRKVEIMQFFLDQLNERFPSR